MSVHTWHRLASIAIAYGSESRIRKAEGGNDQSALRAGRKEAALMAVLGRRIKLLNSKETSIGKSIVTLDSTSIRKGRNGEVREYGAVGGSLIARERALGKLKKRGVELHCVYEAGPCGFAIYRRLQKLGIDCQVVVPSLIPKKPGERIKTNRRDALKLARSYRAGELTPVHVPEACDEAIRDLCRARSDALRDQRRSRQQLKSLTLAPGLSLHG